LKDIAKLLEKTLSRPKGDGPWTLTVTFVSAPGVSDPELLQLGLDAVWKRLRDVPVVYSYEDQRKEAKDGQAAPE
jgi:hypothetical protein